MFFAIFYFVAVLHKLIIQRHVYLKTILRLSSFDLCHFFAKRLKVVRHRLVDKYVSVGKIQHLPCGVCLCQSPYNLKCGICLSCSCSHHEQSTLIALCHMFHCAVDGNSLIIARRIHVIAGVVWLGYDILNVRSDVVELSIHFFEFIRRWKLIHFYVFLWMHLVKTIIESEFASIAAEGERHIKLLRHHCYVVSIINGLLNTIVMSMFTTFSLHDGNRVIVIAQKNIINLFPLSTMFQSVAHDNLTIRIAPFHTYV